MEELPDTRGDSWTWSKCSPGLHMEGAWSYAKSWSVLLPLWWITHWSKRGNKNGVGKHMEDDDDIFVGQGWIPLGSSFEPKSMRLFSWNVQGLGGSHHLLEKRIFRKNLKLLTYVWRLIFCSYKSITLAKKGQNFSKTCCPGIGTHGGLPLTMC